SLRSRGHLGLHVCRRMHQGLSEARGSSRGHSALQTEGDPGVAEGVFPAAGGAMNELPPYTEYHPRWYRRRISTYWWLQRRSYVAFILRELSSLFVAWLVVFLLLLIHAVSLGNSQYQQFLAWCATPWLSNSTRNCDSRPSTTSPPGSLQVPNRILSLGSSKEGSS